MKVDDYWTGLVDVISDELPKNVEGAIYRVLTFADNYETFLEKVTEILGNSGDKVIIIEEAESLVDFLNHSWLTENHEIYEMIPTAEKNKNDVVSGQIEFYTHNDA